MLGRRTQGVGEVCGGGLVSDDVLGKLHLSVVLPEFRN